MSTLVPVIILTTVLLLFGICDDSLKCEPCKCVFYKGGITANCSFRNLHAVPSKLPRGIWSLNMSYNNIAELDRHSFSRYSGIRRLDLSFNKLQHLNKESFLSLPSLLVLDIHSNQLRLDNKTYPSGLFRRQGQLEVLLTHNNSEVVSTDTTDVLHNNVTSTLPKLGYPDVTFSDLTSLYLLRIDGLLYARFGEGFKELKDLTVLIISGYAVGKCVINTLQNETFLNVPTIRHLDISSCELREIELSALQPLKDLQTLDLSNNVDLTIPNVGRGLYGTINSSLEILKINKIYRRRGPGVVITSEDVKYLREGSLKEIHLDGNKIELLNLDVMTLLPKSLTGISAKNNNFFFGPYMLLFSKFTELRWADVSLQDQSHVNPFSVGGEKYRSDLVKMVDEFTENQMDKIRLFTSQIYKTREKVNRPFLDAPDNNMSNLKILSTGQEGNPSVTEEEHKLSNSMRYPKTTDTLANYSGWPGNFTVYVPPKGNFLNISNSKLKYTIPRCRFSKNVLRVLDMSNNFFVRWEGPITGLDYLEFVDLSHNYCDYIAENFTHFFPSLKILNISSNYLGYTLNGKCLENLKKLEILDLSDNKIMNLPRRLFANLPNLRHLNLSTNSLKRWDSTLKDSGNLTVLDISHNLFEDLPADLRYEIDKIGFSFLSINIKGNPLKCDCEHLLFLKWMETRSADKDLHFDFPFECTSYGETTTLTNTTLKTLVLQLEKDCASYVGVMIGSLTVVFLVLSVAVWGLMYRYRWKLRYLYYLTRRRYQGYETVEQEGNFEFDAFISYADEDRWLVVSDMRQRLEERDGLKLCIHNRDFLVGEAIAANILNAVRSSRKTVAILSRNFLASHWCKYEVEMARMESVYTGRNTLVVVILEDVPMNSVSSDMLDVMRHESYIEYTDDAHGQEVFWQNLKRAIMTPGQPV